ncbi:MAG TPA: rhomboid family intramembrane serine protease [Rhizomicrobium sp.]|nr:rhomboid family intramembrane serine protease [Rhizomicrobium sp.]
MAFFQETKPAREPFLRVPAAVTALIAALVLAHIARVFAPGVWPQRILEEYSFNPALYSPAFVAAHHAGAISLFDRVVPFFSYMFLHADTTHIGVNSVWLLAFGPIVAQRLGAVRFILFFLVSGVGGALGYLAFHWGLNEAVIGASGAISGLMGASIRIMRFREPYLNGAAMPLLPVFSQQVLSFSAIWLAINAATGIFGFGAGPGIHAIAWEDHMGGYLAGLLLIGLFDRRPLEAGRGAHT